MSRTCECVLAIDHCTFVFQDECRNDRLLLWPVQTGNNSFNFGGRGSDPTMTAAPHLPGKYSRNPCNHHPGLHRGRSQQVLSCTELLCSPELIRAIVCVTDQSAQTNDEPNVRVSVFKRDEPIRIW